MYSRVPNNRAAQEDFFIFNNYINDFLAEINKQAGSLEQGRNFLKN